MHYILDLFFFEFLFHPGKVIDIAKFQNSFDDEKPIIFTGESLCVNIPEEALFLKGFHFFIIACLENVVTERVPGKLSLRVRQRRGRGSNLLH